MTDEIKSTWKFKNSGCAFPFSKYTTKVLLPSSGHQYLFHSNRAGEN